MEIVVLINLAFPFFYLLIIAKANNFSHEINTDEFDDHVQIHIKNITDDPDRRYRLKKSFLAMKKEAKLQFNEGYKKRQTESFNEGYKKVLTESIESHFSRYFECAFEEWKYELERIYLSCMPLPIQSKNSTQTIPEIPNDILSIAMNDDEWAFQKIEKELWTPSEDEEKKNRSHELKIRYENWFRIITRRDSEVPYYLMLLQEKLVTLESEHKFFYQKYGGIFSRFASKIARSFIITCAVHRFLSKKIEQNLRINKRGFHDELFHWAETWNMDNETISYINLLRFSRFLSPPSKISTIGKFDDIQCLNGWNEKLKKAVCIPYLVSKACKQINLGNFIKGDGFLPRWKSQSWLLNIDVEKFITHKIMLN